jgi:hypothetical protein
MRPFIRVAILTGMLLVASAQVAQAHVHHTEKNPSHDQELANGQNHPAFVAIGGGLIASCVGVNEPPDSGPSWYGMETAHHGPELGDPGAGDGCYVNVDDAATGLRPPDGNPAIK